MPPAFEIFHSVSSSYKHTHRSLAPVLHTDPPLFRSSFCQLKRASEVPRRGPPRPPREGTLIGYTKRELSLCPEERGPTKSKNDRRNRRHMDEHQIIPAFSRSNRAISMMHVFNSHAVFTRFSDLGAGGSVHTTPKAKSPLNFASPSSLQHRQKDTRRNPDTALEKLSLWKLEP